jgi:hypothetical protein
MPMLTNSCDDSDRRLGHFARIFLWLVVAATCGAILLSLPELKRYIKISNM